MDLCRSPYFAAKSNAIDLTIGTSTIVCLILGNPKSYVSLNYPFNPTSPVKGPLVLGNLPYQLPSILATVDIVVLLVVY